MVEFETQVDYLFRRAGRTSICTGQRRQTLGKYDTGATRR
jgi:hypothetical protein